VSKSTVMVDGGWPTYQDLTRPFRVPFRELAFASAAAADRDHRDDLSLLSMASTRRSDLSFTTTFPLDDHDAQSTSIRSTSTHGALYDSGTVSRALVWILPCSGHAMTPHCTISHSTVQHQSSMIS
jgi:hypothetical protein